MNKIVVITFAVMGLIVAAIVTGLVCTIPIWLLWNALMPSVFGLPSLTFVQALWMSLLCGFLFKSSPSSSSK